MFLFRKILKEGEKATPAKTKRRGEPTTHKKLISFFSSFFLNITIIYLYFATTKKKLYDIKFLTN